MDKMGVIQFQFGDCKYSVFPSTTLVSIINYWAACGKSHDILPPLLAFVQKVAVIAPNAETVGELRKQAVATLESFIGGIKLAIYDYEVYTELFLSLGFHFTHRENYEYVVVPPPSILTELASAFLLAAMGNEYVGESSDIMRTPADYETVKAVAFHTLIDCKRTIPRFLPVAYTLDTNGRFELVKLMRDIEKGCCKGHFAYPEHHTRAKAVMRHLNKMLHVLNTRTLLDNNMDLASSTVMSNTILSTIDTVAKQLSERLDKLSELMRVGQTPLPTIITTVESLKTDIASLPETVSPTVRSDVDEVIMHRRQIIANSTTAGMQNALVAEHPLSLPRALSNVSPVVAGTGPPQPSLVKPTAEQLQRAKLRKVVTDSRVPETNQLVQILSSAIEKRRRAIAGNGNGNGDTSPDTETMVPVAAKPATTSSSVLIGNVCHGCGKPTNFHCVCRKRWYCSKQCQELDWSRHSKECGAVLSFIRL